MVLALHSWPVGTSLLMQRQTMDLQPRLFQWILRNIAANDNLRKAVVAAVGAFFAIGTGFDYSPAYQLFLHP